MIYKTGIVIGRFQPFHKGHSYLIKKALALCEQVIIGIGSSNQHNAENPWTTDERREMVKLFLEHERLQNKVKKVIEIPDFYDDQKWLKSITEQVDEFDSIIGNNEWVNRIFETAGYTIHKIPYYKRYLFEGMQIRQLIREKKPWEDRVPEYIAEKIKTKML